ncbi:MAG TPA: hypothetical protein VMR34_02210 [Candidatus Saccharimonadales bacterium]|nr:hypothetical protein [Candidatus Saccharimonadales bacterium]
MNEAIPKPENKKRPLRTKVFLGALAVTSMIGVGLQTAKEVTSSTPPTVTENPLTWAATPIASAVESIEGRTPERPNSTNSRDTIDSSSSQQANFYKELEKEQNHQPDTSQVARDNQEIGNFR